MVPHGTDSMTIDTKVDGNGLTHPVDVKDTLNGNPESPMAEEEKIVLNSIPMEIGMISTVTQNSLLSANLGPELQNSAAKGNQVR